MRLLAIDPGPRLSAYVVLDGKMITHCGHQDNESLIVQIPTFKKYVKVMAIEMIESMGMAVGREVFETVYWIGRYVQQWGALSAERINRSMVKMAICGNRAAKDANIRQSLIDQYGGFDAIKKATVCPKRKNKSHGYDCPVCQGTGLESPAGPLASVKGDIWSALAVGLTYQRLRELQESLR